MSVENLVSDLVDQISALSITMTTNTHPYTRSSISHAEISTIPIFNGDPNTLPLFIDACEDLLKTYVDRANLANPINPYLIRIVKSRLSGEAQSLIGSRRLNTWTDIKSLLQLNFLDQRSEDCLLNDVTSETIRKGENPYTFGQRIKDVLNLLLTKMQLDTREELIPLKTNLYKDTALQTYKRGLMKCGRLGEIIYIKNPTSLEQAMSQVLEYQNWQYRCGQSTVPQSQHRVTEQIRPGYMTTPNNQITPQRLPSLPIQRNPFPAKPNFQNRSNFQHQPNFQNQFRQNLPQYKFPQQTINKPNSFKFAKTPGQIAEKRQPRQQAMDIDPSSSKFRRQTPFGPAAPRNQFHVEELHQQGEEEYSPYSQYEDCYEEQNHEYQPEWDDNTEPFGWEPQEEPNFPVEASEAPILEEHLEFNHLQAIRLPYIFIPEINAKFLIDTGASASSISTQIAQTEFPDYVKYSPFSVTTMHGTTYHNYILEIPSLNTFNAYGQIHRYNIVDFSKKYDGILGLKLMEQMDAVIDFKNKILKTKFTEIPLHFEDPSIKIGARERRIVKIPVDRNLQEVHVTHQIVAPGVEIPENLTTTEDYEAIMEIANFNEYPVEVVYKKGKINKNADALSRIEIHHQDDEENANDNSSTTPQICKNELKELLRGLGDVTVEEIEQQMQAISREDIEEILGDLNAKPGPSGTLQKKTQPPQETDSDSLHSNINQEPETTIPIVEIPIDIQKIQIFIEEHILPTEVLFDTENGKMIYHVKLDKNNLTQELVNVIKDIMPQGSYHIFTTDKIYKEMCNVYTEHFTNNGPKIYRCTQRVRILTRPEEKIETIIRYHEGKTNHRGIDETLKQIRKQFYWAQMKTDITEYIKKCEICQRNKYDRRPPKVPFQITEPVDKPFSKIHIDTIAINTKSFLTLIDVFTKYLQVYPIKGKTAVEVAEKLIESFSIHGAPQEIVMDKGLEFNNATLRELLKLHKINIHYTTPQNPSSNAPIERVHSTLLEHIRLLKNRKVCQDMEQLMRLAVLAYNSTNHSVTGVTPFELLYGHTNAKEPLDLYYDNIYFQEYIQQHKERTRCLYENIARKMQNDKERKISRRNEKREEKELKVGQQVYVKPSKYYTQKTKERYRGPFTVTQIFENNTVEVKNKQGKTFKYHINSLKLGVVTEPLSEEN